MLFRSIAFSTDQTAPATLSSALRLTGGSFGLAKEQLRFASQLGRSVSSLSWSRTTVDGSRQYSRADVRQLSAAADIVMSGSTTLALRALHADMPTALNPGALTAAEYAANRDSAAATNIARGANKFLLQSQYSARVQHAAPGGTDWSATGYVLRRFVDNPLATAPRGTTGATIGTYSTLNRWVTGARFDVAHALCLCADATPAAAGTRGTPGTPGTATVPRVSAGLDVQRSFDVRRNWRATKGVRSTPTDTLQLNQGESVISAGPFLTLAWQPTKVLSLSSGARWDQLTFDVFDHFLADNVNNSGSRRMTAASGHVGASVTASRAFTAYANYSTAFETPTTTELNARPDGAGGFNPDLGPQRVRTMEIGARGTVGPALSYTVSLFRSNATDAIIQYLETNGRAYFRNAGRTRNDGAEIGLSARIASWLDGTAAWTAATYRFVTYRVPNGAVTDTLDGKTLAGVPNRYMRLGARTHWRAASLDVDHTWSAGMFGDDKNTIRVADWGKGQLNVRAAWSGAVGAVRVAPFVAVNNLFNEAYVGAVTLNGAFGRVLEPAPLRNYYVGTELEWRVLR